MFARTAIILALVSIPAAACGQGVVRDDFEGPQAVLRPAGGDVRHQARRHERSADGPHSGRWCEQLQIAGNNGTAVYYSYPIPPARVISELVAGIWLRADRPGLQILVRVVLPRSKHPDSGEPLTALVRGSDYQRVGNWELLQVGNLPRALEWQVRVLRSQFGPEVDAREAYVDLLLINVYGGPGTTNVWVDDFEASGIVAPGGFAEPGSAGETGRAPPPPSVPPVELTNRLLVGGEPFFPRIVEYHGEPLARLKALGFNGVRVSGVPTAELAAEAARNGMWLLAPPPAEAQLSTRGSAAETAGIGAALDSVLAWDLGSGLSIRELEPTRRWAELLGGRDPRQRPIFCLADSDLESYTRPPFRLLVARRDTLGTSFELARYADWLEGRAQLARAGAPLWAVIPTQPSPELVEQMRLAAGMPLPVPSWQEGQLRAMVRAALAARARGLLFTSESRLDAPDAATRARALMLELVNLELALIERWPAAGNFASGADTSDPHTRGAVMETDRSRLMLPVYAPPGGQFVLGTQPAAQVSFKVAGVPEGDNAYELSLARLRNLPADRVAGGTRVVLDDFNRDSLVVFTQDPHVIRNLKTRLAKTGRRAAEVARRLAAARIAGHDAVVAQLAQVGRALPATQEARARALEDLRQCEAALGADPAKAYELARHALEVVRQIERVYWEQATAAPNRPLADPLSASFATLPAHYRFRQEITAAPRSENRLREGGCENLPAMLAAGWKHYQHEQSGIQTAVDLAPGAAHSGRAGLRLRSTPADPERKPPVVETPPLWVTSAPVAVEPGDLVQIQAQVRVEQPISGSVDGLLVVDTLSGKPLALRIGVTQGWQQITMYRAAARRGPAAVTFALAGMGEAAVDDVSIAIVRHAPAAGQHVRR